MCNQSGEHSPEVRHGQICDQFAVISFPEEEDTLYIVASNWLEKTESTDFHICSWPPYKGDARIKVAVLENETPSCTWGKCSARLIKQCSTYESAEEILKTIEIVSSRRSEVLFEKRCKQIRKEYFLKQVKMEANLLSSQDCFNSTSVNCNSSQSSPIICAVTANANESFLHNCSSVTSTEDNRRNNLSTQTESFLGDTSSLSVLSNPSDVQILNEASNERGNWGNLFKNPELNSHAGESSFELYVLKTLNEIKGQLILNSNQLNEFSKQLLNVSKEIFDSKENLARSVNDAFKEVFPFNSAEDLQQFDIKLKDKNFKKKLIRHFSKLGGTSVSKCTAHLLNYIMKPSVAIEFCWFGKKHAKKAFYCLELVDVIGEAVRIHFENTTDREIMKITQDWLRHAKQKLEKSSKS